MIAHKYTFETYCFQNNIWNIINRVLSRWHRRILHSLRALSAALPGKCFGFKDGSGTLIVQVSSTVTALLTIFYVLIALIAFIGNCLVMYVVCVSRWFKRSQKWNLPQYFWLVHKFRPKRNKQNKLLDYFWQSFSETGLLLFADGCRQWPTTTSRPWRSLTWCWPCSASPSSSERRWCSAGTSRSSCVSSVLSCRLSR